MNVHSLSLNKSIDQICVAQNNRNRNDNLLEAQSISIDRLRKYYLFSTLCSS